LHYSQAQQQCKAITGKYCISKKARNALPMKIAPKGKSAAKTAALRQFAQTTAAAMTTTQQQLTYATMMQHAKATAQT
jgi:hypothetical protein